MNQKVRDLAEAIMRNMAECRKANSIALGDNLFYATVVDNPEQTKIVGATILFFLGPRAKKIEPKEAERIVLFGEKPPFDTKGDLMFSCCPMIKGTTGTPDQIFLAKETDQKSIAEAIIQYLTKGEIHPNVETAEEVAKLFNLVDVSKPTIH